MTQTRTTSRDIENLDELAKTLISANAIKGTVRIEDRAIGAAAIIDGEEATFGTPVVEGASVEAKIVKNGKGKKIRIFKYNAKKGYRKRQGHRQPYTKVEIAKIVR